MGRLEKLFSTDDLQDVHMKFLYYIVCYITPPPNKIILCAVYLTTLSVVRVYGKDVEGSGRCLLQELSQHSPGETEETHQIPQSGQ
jgi:hypothetical protein